MIVPQVPQRQPTFNFLNFTTDITFQIFAFCNAIGLDALAVCCKTLYKQKPADVFVKSLQAHHAAIVEELRTKTSLSRKEMGTYMEALGGKPGDWDCVLRHCPLLEELDLSYFFLHDGVRHEEDEENKIISLLLSTKVNCHGIIRLNLDGCRIGDKTLDVLGKSFPNLTHLNLCRCGYSVDGILTFLMKCGKHLISLNLAYANTFEKKGSKVINCIADCCPNLMVLDLENQLFLGFLPKDPVEADNAIILLSRRCRKLEKLITSNAGITDQSLFYLGENCKNLKTLIIFNNENITEEGKADIKQKLPKLEMPVPKSIFE
jgi:hypothetical protein